MLLRTLLFTAILSLNPRPPPFPPPVPISPPPLPQYPPYSPPSPQVQLLQLH